MARARARSTQKAVSDGRALLGAEAWGPSATSPLTLSATSPWHGTASQRRTQRPAGFASSSKGARRRATGTPSVGGQERGCPLWRPERPLRA
eukprot:4461786-Pleurochrysis_carterae.AAC.2